MDLKENHIKSNRKPIIRYLYLITLFFLVLTGFGQMPVFKRYYIADIPGLGWLAQFFVTHYMHYLFKNNAIQSCHKKYHYKTEMTKI